MTLQRIKQTVLRCGHKDAITLLSEPLLQVKQRQRQQRPPTEPSIFTRVSRRLDRLTCKRIIFLRYGSLTNFNQSQLTVSEISRQLRLPWTTVKDFLNRFHRVGSDFEATQANRRHKFMSIPPRLRRALISKKLLQEWAPYSIKERVDMIERVWQFKMSTTQLAKLYRHHLIKYRAAKQVYRYSITNAARLERQRKEFAEVLGNLITRRSPLIYMDETTFTSWSIKKKSWSTRLDINQHPIDDKRFTVTVYGAIGSCLSEPVYMLGSSTN